ncbi:hypothetical protein ScPMuIL_017334 [Solemya velum]
MALVHGKLLTWLVIATLPFLLESATLYQQIPCKVDLVLVVDGSDSISENEFETLRSSLAKLTSDLWIELNQVQLGIIVYSTGIAATIDISPDKTHLQEEISTLPHPADGTETDEGIRAMTKMILSQGRPDVPKIGVVITDGNSKNASRTAAAAEDARNEGIHMMAVGVTSEIEIEELQAIASKDEWALSVDAFDQLAGALEELFYVICPSTTTVPTTTTIPQPAWPCDKCRIVNGVGYTKFSYQCDKFIKCYFGEGNEVKAVTRQCGYGTLWDQSKLTCAHYTDVNCIDDPCRYLPPHYTRPYDVANSAYWECVDEKSVPKCCDDDSIFIENKGCVYRSWGVDECTPQYVTPEPCDLRDDPQDPARYLQYQEGYGWRSMPCAPGTLFSLKPYCGCSTHTTFLPQECTPELYIPFNVDAQDHSGKNVYVKNEGVTIESDVGIHGAGYFDGNSRLMIPRFSNLDVESYLRIQFKYKETVESRIPMALVINGDCGSLGTVGVVQDSEKVYFGLRDQSGELVMTEVEKKETSDWTDVTFTHEQNVLTGKVNRKSQQVPANGRFQEDACALQVGYWQTVKDQEWWNFQSFTGYIDELYVWQCKPKREPRNE